LHLVDFGVERFIAEVLEAIGGVGVPSAFAAVTPTSEAGSIVTAGAAAEATEAPKARQKRAAMPATSARATSPGEATLLLSLPRKDLAYGASA
jgi:hypothetical protein